jgi:hypothetical protein
MYSNSTQKITKNFTDIESYADSENFARRKKGTGTLVADPQLFYEDRDQAFFQYPSFGLDPNSMS